MVRLPVSPMNITYQTRKWDSCYLCKPLIKHVIGTADTMMHVIHQTDQWYSWYIYAWCTPRLEFRRMYTCLLSCHAIVTAPKHSPKHKFQHTCNCNTVPGSSGVPRGGFGGGSTSLPPKFRSFDKDEPNSQFRWKYIHYNLIRIRVAFIYKLTGTPN
jgi:hypothetical protein